MYTVKDIATLIGVHKETVKTWIREGKLEARMRSKCEGYVIEEDALYHFLKEHPSYELKIRKLEPERRSAERSRKLRELLEEVMRMRDDLGKLYRELESLIDYEEG
jgi:excisionase family DNA binding protein